MHFVGYINYVRGGPCCLGPCQKLSVFFKGEKKKQGDCVNGLLGIVLTGFHKPVTCPFVLSAQLGVQVISMKLPFQNGIQEPTDALCSSKLQFL